MSCQALVTPASWDRDVDSSAMFKCYGDSWLFVTRQICGNGEILDKHVVSNENTVFRPESTTCPQATMSVILPLLLGEKRGDVPLSFHFI